jgi:hypothetical protein
VEAGKDLDTIAGELCTDVKLTREKIIRVIKDFLGNDYLIEHASTLGYDIQRAKLAKKRKHKKHEKINAKIDSDSGSKKELVQSNKDELTHAIIVLVGKFGLDAVMKVITEIQKEEEAREELQ